MVIAHSEIVKSRFKGTIIDIETIGNFCEEYNDSRYYQNHIPFIFGHIDKDGLKVHCVRKNEPLKKLKPIITRILPDLERPLYAFNCSFEKGVLYHSWGIVINFEGELNKEKYEGKWQVVQSLGISNYGDPFYDVGKKCCDAWLRGDIRHSMRHNRSCLLKERDILLMRGCRTPDPLKLFHLER
jgi:hypothetical protein